MNWATSSCQHRESKPNKNHQHNYERTHSPSPLTIPSFSLMSLNFSEPARSTKWIWDTRVYCLPAWWGESGDGEKRRTKQWGTFSVSQLGTNRDTTTEIAGRNEQGPKTHNRRQWSQNGANQTNNPPASLLLPIHKPHQKHERAARLLPDLRELGSA